MKGDRVIQHRVAVVLKGRTLPGKRDELHRLWSEHLRPRAAENATQRAYAFCIDPSDADVFWIFELYDDPSAMAANAQEPWFAEYMSRTAPLLAGAPEMLTGAPLWTKGMA